MTPWVQRSWTHCILINLPDCLLVVRRPIQAAALLVGPNGTDSQATSQAGSTDGNEDAQPAKPAPKPRAQHKVIQPT